MYIFFTTKKWLFWSWLGTISILSSLWVQVKVDVAINEWFGHDEEISKQHYRMVTPDHYENFSKVGQEVGQNRGVRVGVSQGVSRDLGLRVRMRRRTRKKRRGR